MITRIRILIALKAFPEVQWDRWSGLGDRVTVFGWVPRSDGGRDFVVLSFGGNLQLGMVTSSAKWSAVFAGRLGLEHSDCKIVKETFKELDNYA